MIVISLKSTHRSLSIDVRVLDDGVDEAVSLLLVAVEREEDLREVLPLPGEVLPGALREISGQGSRVVGKAREKERVLVVLHEAEHLGEARAVPAVEFRRVPCLVPEAFRVFFSRNSSGMVRVILPLTW